VKAKGPNVVKTEWC